MAFQACRVTMRASRPLAGMRRHLVQASAMQARSLSMMSESVGGAQAFRVEASSDRAKVAAAITKAIGSGQAVALVTDYADALYEAIRGIRRADGELGGDHISEERGLRVVPYTVTTARAERPIVVLRVDQADKPEGLQARAAPVVLHQPDKEAKVMESLQAQLIDRPVQFSTVGARQSAMLLQALGMFQHGLAQQNLSRPEDDTPSVGVFMTVQRMYRTRAQHKGEPTEVFVTTEGPRASEASLTSLEQNADREDGLYRSRGGVLLRDASFVRGVFETFLEDDVAWFPRHEEVAALRRED